MVAGGFDRWQSPYQTHGCAPERLNKIRNFDLLGQWSEVQKKQESKELSSASGYPCRRPVCGVPPGPSFNDRSTAACFGNCHPRRQPTLWPRNAGHRRPRAGSPRSCSSHQVG
ncbi:hypothetical protein VARIO8X_90184 [Burkholderiales bacterium 8X]|nr:hypothetical protein VARIO8X_90184 [Burkholderiales bacterium 8X]